MGYLDHMNGGMHVGGLGVLAGWLLVALAVGVVAVVLTAMRGPGRSSSVPGRPIPGAQSILDERLARGEIDSEEYLARSRALNAR